MPHCLRLIFESDASGRAPRIERYMGTNGDCGVQDEPLRIGGKEFLLAVDKHAPIGSEHQLGAGLKNEGEILIDAKILKNSIADIAEIEQIAGADSGIGLKGTELGKVVLKEEHG